MSPRIAARLSLASLAVMAGVVWAANPGATGWWGVLAGAGAALAGIALAVRSFRA